MLKVISLAVASLILSAGTVSAAEGTRPSYQDWSGVWLNVTRGPFSNPGANSPIPVVGVNPPPLKPEYDKEWRASILAAQRGAPINDPMADCKWPGMPAILASTMPQEFLILPDRVVILYELMSQVRRIFTDGTPVPEDVDFSYNGFSTGRWEGDTLVVDTIAITTRTFIDDYQTPHTDKLHVVERYRLIDGGKAMEVSLHVEDEGAFTTPWNAIQRYRRAEPGVVERDVPVQNDATSAVGNASPLQEGYCADMRTRFDFEKDEPIPQANKPDF